MPSICTIPSIWWLINTQALSITSSPITWTTILQGFWFFTQIWVLYMLITYHSTASISFAVNYLWTVVFRLIMTVIVLASIIFHLLKLLQTRVVQLSQIFWLMRRGCALSRSHIRKVGQVIINLSCFLFFA